MNPSSTELSMQLTVYPIHLATIGMIVHCQCVNSRNLPSCVSRESNNRQLHNICFKTEQDGCQPGMYLPDPCGDCATCPSQTFTPNWNNCSLCLTCQHCEHGVKDPCNAEKDAVCHDPPISSTTAKAAAPVSQELTPDPGAHRTSTEEARVDPSLSTTSSSPPSERSATTPDFTRTSMGDAKHPKLDTASEVGPSHVKPDLQQFIIAVMAIIILLLVIFIICQNKKCEDRACTGKKLNGAQPDDHDDPPAVEDRIDAEDGEIHVHPGPLHVDMHIEDEIDGGAAAGANGVRADTESVACGNASGTDSVGGGAATGTDSVGGSAATGTDGVRDGAGGAATGTGSVGGSAASGTEGDAGDAADGVGGAFSSNGSAGPTDGGALDPHLPTKSGKQIGMELLRTNGHITGCNAHVDTDEPCETESLL